MNEAAKTFATKTNQGADEHAPTGSYIHNIIPLSKHQIIQICIHYKLYK